MLFKFSSVLYFSKYHDCKRRTEVLVFFFVFSEAMSPLKVFTSSRVCIIMWQWILTLPPLSRLRLVWFNFCLPFSGRFSQDFLTCSFSRAKEVFYASSRICTSVQKNEEPPAHFEKRLCILGPMLFLIYINDLPNSLRGAVPRMFADDTNLTLSAKTLTELMLALTPELNNLSCWLKA